MSANEFNTPSKNPVTIAQNAIDLVKNTIVARGMTNGVLVESEKRLVAEQILDKYIETNLGKKNVHVVSNQADVDAFLFSNQMVEPLLGDDAEDFKIYMTKTVMEISEDAVFTNNTLYIPLESWVNKMTDVDGHKLFSLIIKNNKANTLENEIKVAFNLSTIDADITASATITGLNTDEETGGVLLTGGEAVQFIDVTAVGSGVEGGNTDYTIVGNSDVR
jgi:hypothetical protein